MNEISDCDSESSGAANPLINTSRHTHICHHYFISISPALADATHPHTLPGLFFASVPRANDTSPHAPARDPTLLNAVPSSTCEAL
jgi:hypothetical protein